MTTLRTRLHEISRVWFRVTVFLLFVFLAFDLSFAQVVPAATWVPTGSMILPRAHQIAILLPNGQVLVAGGTNGTSGLVERYDPGTGTWTGAGTLDIVNITTATLLSNGQILVTGAPIGGSYNGAEIYDPNTGQSTPTGTLATSRLNPTATLLPKGQVLVAGGYQLIDSGGRSYPVSLNSAEIYDLATGKWADTESMAADRAYHTAVPLSNGKVLVVGGVKIYGMSPSTPLASAEIFDPGTGTWTTTGSLHTARVGNTETLLRNGQVLVTGGKDSAYNPLSSSELYDPVAGLWNISGAMTTAREGHTATLLLNGKVLVVGGNDAQFAIEALDSAELYNPSTGIWTATRSLNLPRISHASTLLPNGRVLTSGGEINSSCDVTSSVELYNQNSSISGAILPLLLK